MAQLPSPLHTRPPVRTSIGYQFSRYHLGSSFVQLAHSRLSARQSFFRVCRPGSLSSGSPPLVRSSQTSSGSIPLQGFSSAWPLSIIYSPLVRRHLCRPRKLLIHFPPFFPWALPPLGYIVRPPHSSPSFASKPLLLSAPVRIRIHLSNVPH